VPLHKGSAPIFCYVTNRASLPRSEPRETKHESSQEITREAATDRPTQPASREYLSQSDALAPLLASITAAAAAGVHWIHLREKDLPARELARLTHAAIANCAAPNPRAANSTSSPPRIFVNDRLDVAIAERAAGVHLGENSLPIAETRRLLQMLQNLSAQNLSGEFLAGVSCHSLSSAQTAAAAGADYIFFGPVFPTPAKRIYGPEQGLEKLAEVCRAVSIPVLAIGGINAANASHCLDAGASGIAAIRMFQQPHELPSFLDALPL
jgi:thiamine-phosphate pyrophosphorylase